MHSCMQDFKFEKVYGPTGPVAPGYPTEDLRFEMREAYASYNWELFFHIPFEIATKLNQDQQFQELSRPRKGLEMQ